MGRIVAPLKHAFKNGYDRITHFCGQKNLEKCTIGPSAPSAYLCQGDFQEIRNYLTFNWKILQQNPTANTIFRIGFYWREKIKIHSN